MKRKTPEELAVENPDFTKVSLYLRTSNIEYLKQRAKKANISLSKLVNEAVDSYTASIRDKKND